MSTPKAPLSQQSAHNEALKETLEAVIERTYDLEKEYKLLQKSMQGFQQLVHQVIESQPNAMWITKKENKEEIFFQNSASKQLPMLFEKIDIALPKQEIEIENQIFLVHISNVNANEPKTIISATDITEQKRSERLASMGQIAAHLAHEIRNPIGSISLMASTLLKRVNPGQKPLVEEIKSAIGRVERIIKSTLLFTKGVGITPKLFSLSLLEDQIYQVFAQYPYTKEIALKIDFPRVTLSADRELLTIVMQNFLYNAIDAIEEDENDEGCICFTYGKESDFDTVKITDSGVAIENPNILYEPFKTTKTKGHGLGLALSLEIIKAHNGKIELLKETKGFKIYLPRN
jgi:signal transduction histidine kinase